MTLFDSHAHLTDQRFDEDREALIQKLEALNKEDEFLIVDCAADENDFDGVLKNAQHDIIYAAFGVHPHSAAGVSKDYLSKIEMFAQHKKCVAIGEIGLDYHYDFSPRAKQREVLIAQLELASALQLPVILHDREAHDDMYAILKTFAGRITGVMHCFSGGTGLVEPTLDLGLYLGFGGGITFQKARKTQDAAYACPLDKILIETDSPYMSPVPFRGQRNNPSKVRYVCDKLAEIKAMPGDEIARQTFKNAKQLFGIQ